MAQHKDLPEADLHEIKGASTATSGQVPVANGSGSTTFTTINNLNKISVTHNIQNVSTAASYFVVPGVAGTIEKIYSVINGALGTADVGLSFEIAGTPITSGNITVTQAGSAAGDVDSSTPTAANVITEGQAIEMITDGASTNTVRAAITFIIDIS